ncbi:peptidoglycan editing factor PgeF [Leptolyngbya sp. BC1307]|uniref:peptidoglycan editing factor PgeF n=1 Tax=Leptolyngbya sp. BC1307 TaxID=2029589 RepID=UPI000EFAC60F|nr:peptidoglycan editing factor PgeF [Leptolyngbya sp. BC1307]
MQLWTWHTWQERSFLTCSLLPQPHGFFTRHFYPAAPEALVKVISPAMQVYRVKQVHSGDVLTPTEIEASPKLLPLADGIITERPEQAVWACSADCTPALVSDVITGQVAAVHAGWRGTAQKILPAAVARFQAQGSQLENLRFVLGPAIDGSVYQVGRDVAAEVVLSIEAGISSEPLTGDALIEAVRAIKNPPLLSDPQPDRLRLDVRRVNQIQLEQMGIEPEQIAIAPYCTYQDPANFFSYRRTHEKKVQWSGIVSR